MGLGWFGWVGFGYIFSGLGETKYINTWLQAVNTSYLVPRFLI